MKWGLGNVIPSVRGAELQRKMSKAAQTFCSIGNGPQ